MRRKSLRSRRGRRSVPDRNRRAFHVEQLEERTVLAVGAPDALNISPAEQLLTGPDRTLFELPAVGAADPYQQLFRMAFDHDGGPEAFAFGLQPIMSSSDAALAIYDADGNLIQVADDDLVPARPGDETLIIDLASQTEYVLAILGDSNNPAADFRLVVTPFSQSLNSPIVLDPQTGMTSYAADSAAELLGPLADVNFFPLILENAGAEAVVEVSPTSLDVVPAVTVFGRLSPLLPWIPQVSTAAVAPGQSISLTVSPFAGRSLTDAEYVLAVAPAGFASAGGSLQIDVTAPVLGPATVTPPMQTPLVPPAVGLGLTRFEHSSNGPLAAGTSELIGFRAPADGQATIFVSPDSPGIDPVVSVYDEAGATLLAAHTRTESVEFGFTMEVDAGVAYLLRVADVGGDEAGAFHLAVETAYVATDAVLDQPIVDLGPAMVGAALPPPVYRLNAPPGTDALVVEVTPTDPGAQNAIAPQATLLSDDLAPVTQSSPAGQPLVMHVDVSNLSGPFDLLITGQSGSGPVAVRVGHLSIPLDLDLDALAGMSIDLAGDLSANQLAGGFGSLRGVSFYQHVTEAAQDPMATLEAGGAAALPMIALYEEVGGRLSRVAYQFPDAVGLASMTRELAVNRYHGMAVIPLGLSGGPMSINVDGPLQTGVGVGMAPDPPPKFPEANYDGETFVEEDNNITFVSELNIRDVVLETEFQQHLWRTILPLNMREDVFNPLVVTLTPKNGLGATVEVIRPNGTATGDVIDTLTVFGVNQGSIQITSPTISELQGQTLLFRVTPLPDQLDDGIYTLQMSVETDNPHPFEAVENYWRIVGNLFWRLDDPYTEPFSDVNQPPPANLAFIGNSTEIDLNQFGDGARTRTFTSQEPYTPGSVHVYRFKAPGEGPLTVRTVGLESTVNTNLRLYRRVVIQGQNFLAPLEQPVVNSTPIQVLPNFDWFPADRSTIDAQTYLRHQGVNGLDNNDSWSLGVPDGQYFYVVVKNQEASTGQYRIEIDAPPFPIADFARVPSDAQGSDTATILGLAGEAEAIRFVEVQVPDYHGGTLAVNTGLGQGFWELDVFDASGQFLPGEVIDSGSISGGTFELAPGPQAVYVRVQERVNNFNDSATVTVGADIVPPTFSVPPSTSLRSGGQDRLEVNPFGDGSVSGSVSRAEPSQVFVMQAASGPLTIAVQPATRADADLRWGVYINGQLVAWDQTSRHGGNPLNPDSLWTQIVLPDIPNVGFARQADCFDSEALASIVPCADPDDPHPADFLPEADADFAFDRSAYHTVVVRVQAVDPNDTSSFTIDVESGADLPLRTRELTINPTDGEESLMTLPGVVTTANSITAPPVSPLVTGGDWVRLAIPSGTTGPIELEVSRPPLDFAAVSFEYRVYSLDGILLASGTSLIPAVSPQGFTAHVPLPTATVTGGSAYYVQVMRAGNPNGQLVLRATAPLAGKNGPEPPLEIQMSPTGFPNVLFNSFFFDPEGHADPTFNVAPSDAQLAFAPFWVSAQGAVTIRAQLTGASGPTVALYRARLINNANDEFMPVDFDVVLLDYTNQAVQGAHELTANLDPGLYAVRVTRTNTGQAASVAFDIDLPSPRIEEVVLDPNFGRSDLAGLKISDVAKNVIGQSAALQGTNLVASHRRTLFRVVAPPGSIAGLTATAEATGRGRTVIGTVNEDAFALLHVWRRQGNGFVNRTIPDSLINPELNQQFALINHDASIGPTPKVVPGEDLYISLVRRSMANTIEVAANIPVPISGTPDLVVLPLGLLPNNGETKVTVQVTNVGYAPANPSTGLFRLRDASLPANLQWQTSTQQIPTLGPFGSSVRVLAWDPVTPQDQVEFVADPEVNLNDEIIGDIEELDEENNDQLRTLSEVDPSPPHVVSFQLADPNYDGTGTNDAVWGRYVENVSGTHAKYRVQVTDADGDDDLYQTLVVHPDGAGTFPGEFTVPHGPETVNELRVDFWKLEPTSGEFPNHFVAYALDQWGLESSRETRTALVVERPSWPSSIVFDRATREYVLEFDEDVVDYERTTNQLFGVSGIPFIGSKKNSLLLHVEGATTATLNPLTPVNMDVSTRAVLKVLGQTIFDETFQSPFPSSSILSLQTNIDISSQTLDADAFTVGLKIVELPVLALSSPEIPLFTYGVPGLAEISVNLVVGLLADMSAGLTFAFDTTNANVLGLARPTFVGMDITPYITIIGEAEVLGFLDIASLEVTVGLEIGVDVGLEAPLTPNNPVPVSQLGSNLGVEVSGTLVISAEADVLGWEVWSDSWSFPLGSIGDDVITWDEVDPFNNPLPQTPSQGQSKGLPAKSPSGQNNGSPPPVPINPTKTGGSLLGPLNVLPSPQLVIDGPGGDALFLQIADPGTGRGNLHFSRRTGGNWGPLTQIPQNENVSNPALALTNDAAKPGAVVVYQATTVPDLSTATFDQYFSSQEIRWRYYDGSSWGSEQMLESNGQFDGNPALAFNSSGQGVLAWAHNTNAQPLQSPGDNEVMVSLWNASAQSWLPPTQLTSDVDASDARPTVHMADDGTPTVVWLRNPDTSTTNSAVGKEVWFSQHTNGAWTPAAPLPTLGLPDFSSGGRITQLAIGSSGDDGQGRERIDVLIAYSRSIGEFEAESKLVHRAAWDDTFASPTAVQVVSDSATFSELRTLPNPDGGLLAYWQQGAGDGIEVFASNLSPPSSGGFQSPGGTWSEPTQLTFSDIQELSPTIAFDTDGGSDPMLQLLYHQKQPLDRPPATIPPTTSDGVPMQGDVNASRLPMLPELGFSRPLTFPGVPSAPAGSETPGKATVVNSGLAGTQVIVEYMRTAGGQTTLLDSQKIFLGPGRSYDLVYPFAVEAGQQTFSIEVSAGDFGGQEMIGPSDNVTQANVVGGTDLVLTSLAVDGPPPVGGQQVTIIAEVSNVSTIDVSDPFAVTLWLGDPSAPLGSGMVIDQQVLPGLQQQSSQQVPFTWTVPADGGSFVLTAVADNSHLIIEAIEFNNAERLNVHVESDASVGIVTTTLLNYSGVDNVSVQASLFNPGDTALTDVEVELLWSRNNGPFQVVDQTTVPLLARGGRAQRIEFTTDGLAGNNTYRVSIVDPNVDADPTNNSALANLFITGFADLIVADIKPSTMTPQQGGPLTLDIDVQNAGIDDAEDVRVEVFANSPQFGRRLVGRTFVEHIAPLSTRGAIVEIDTSRLAGAVRLEVVLDRLDKILEISDLNNTDFITLDFTPQQEGEVEDVRVFYNNSAFDGRDPAGNDADVNAIDTSKVPLEIGQMATFANITGYSKGLNGITFVVSSLPGDGADLTPADFRIRVGTTDDVNLWSKGPEPNVTVLANSTTSGADRILLTFPDNSIQDTFAAFEILATANTGLTGPHLAIFGNVRGETGAAFVGRGQFFGRDAADLQAIAPSLFQPADVTSAADVNKDRMINAFDFQVIPVVSAPSGGAFQSNVLRAITPTLGRVLGPDFAAAAFDEALADDAVGQAASFPLPMEGGPTPLAPIIPGSSETENDGRVGSTDEETSDRELAFATFANDTAEISGLVGEAPRLHKR